MVYVRVRGVQQTTNAARHKIKQYRCTWSRYSDPLGAKPWRGYSHGLLGMCRRTTKKVFFPPPIIVQAHGTNPHQLP